MNNLFNNSRDSYSENPGDDSKRSSIANLIKSQARFNSSNKITIDKRLFFKMTNFLKNIVKELNIESPFNDIIKIEEFVQTETKGSYFINSREQFSDTEFQELMEKIETLDKELEKNKKNLQVISTHNADLTDQIKKLNDLLGQSIKENTELNQEILLLKKELEEREISRSNKINLECSEESNMIINNNSENNKNIITKTDIPTLGNFDKISNYKNNLLKISSFLHSKEFFFLFHSSKKTNQILADEKIHITKLKCAIETKNREIANLKALDINKEYEISDNEIERLIKEYVFNYKVPGVDLKNLLFKAITYVERDIKKTLGINSNNLNNINSQDDVIGKKGLFNSLNNMFNKIIKKKDEKKKTTPGGIGNVENINSYDKYLTTENSQELNLDFDYSNSDEIKTLLVQFFTSLRNSPQAISNFISELINEYGDFLFYSHRTLVEIKELDIVKNLMHERFKKSHKICMELENELEDLHKFAKTNKEIKDILLKQKQEIEVKYTDSITQVTYLKNDLNKTTNKLLTINEKYSKMEQEYESFKSKLIKEFKNLKTELDNTTKERDVLLETLFEFKKYFMRFHITDDGDIAYIEEV